MEWILGIVLSALAALATTWLKGFLDPHIPSPARVRLFVKNIATPKLKLSGDRFHVVPCWLADDYSGHDTDTVERAFRALPGITLLRSSSIVKAYGAADDWRPAMLKQARTVLHRWNADLVIAGLVKKPGQVLSIWFIPIEGEDTLDRGDTRHYTLQEVSLRSDFHEDLRSQLRAMTLAAVAPLADNETRAGLLERGLQASANKIRAMIKAQPNEKPEVRAALHGALGTALAAQGERRSGTETLEQAANAFRAALEIYTRDQAPLLWATTLNNLGAVHSSIGERVTGTAHLKQAVAAHRAALGVFSPDRMPFDRARTQTNLGDALQSLGERQDGRTHLEQAVTAYRAALEVHTQDHMPLQWGVTQNSLGNALVMLAEHEGGMEHHEQAVVAYHAALDVFTPEHPLNLHDKVQHNLAQAIQRLRQRHNELKSVANPSG